MEDGRLARPAGENRRESIFVSGEAFGTVVSSISITPLPAS